MFHPHAVARLALTLSLLAVAGAAPGQELPAASRGNAARASTLRPLTPRKAESSTEDKPEAGGRRPRTPAASSWTTAIGGLTIVLLLIGAAALLLRKHAPAVAGVLPAEALQVLGRRHVDARNSIQLVRCGSRILVLANCAQQGLRTLAEISDPVEVDLLAGLCRRSDATAGKSDFGQFINRHLAPQPAPRRGEARPKARFEELEALRTNPELAEQLRA